MPLLPTLDDPRFNTPTDQPIPELVREAPWYWYLSLIVAEIVALRIRLGSMMEPIDDAYITLRHVKHIIEGHGWVFNLGEPMLGTTTVLYPLLLSAICLFTGLDPVQGGIPLAIGCELLNFPLLLFVATRLSHSYCIGAFVTIVYSFSRYAALGTMGYMEAPLFVLTILATVAASMLPATRRNRALTALCAALTVLCRPEGVLIALILFGTWIVHERKLPFREIGIFLVPTVAWLLFALYYFGSPIPQSVHAKRVAYFPYPFQAATEIRFHFSTLLTGILPPGKTPDWFGMLIGGPLWLIGTTRALRSGRLAAILLFGFNILFLLAYLIANPFVFLWYVIPLEPAYLIGIALGAKAATESAASALSSFTPRLQRALLGSGAALVLMALPLRYNVYRPLAHALGLSKSSGDRPMLTYKHSFPGTIAGLNLEREGWYKLVADDLAPFVNEKTTILASEFGATGYFSAARLVSSVGHVSPEVVKYLPPLMDETDYPAINHSIPVSMVKGLHPEYVMSLELYIRKSLLKDPWFPTEYRLWKKYPATVFSSDGLYVFQRLDLSGGAQTASQPGVTEQQGGSTAAAVPAPSPAPAASPKPSPAPSASPAQKSRSQGTARWSTSSSKRPQKTQGTSKTNAGKKQSKSSR